MSHKGEPAVAVRAVEDKPSNVSRDQTQAERQQLLKYQSDQLKSDKLKRYPIGVNLYIRNLDDTIDDERLHKEFSRFGKIKSAKVMMEDGRSRGFGFVSFSRQEEATKAMAEMNGCIIGRKPLYVAIAQVKNDRKAILESEFMQRKSKIQVQQIPIDQKQQSAGTTDNKSPRKAILESEYMQRTSEIQVQQIPNDQKQQSAGTTDSKSPRIQLQQGSAQKAEVKNDHKAILESDYLESLSKYRMQQMEQLFRTGAFNQPLPQPPHGPAQVAQVKNESEALLESEYVKRVSNIRIQEVTNEKSQSEDTQGYYKPTLQPAKVAQVRPTTSLLSSPQGNASVISPRAQYADMRGGQSVGLISPLQPSGPGMNCCPLGALTVCAQDRISTVHNPTQSLPMQLQSQLQLQPQPQPLLQPQPQPLLQPQLQSTPKPQLQPQPLLQSTPKPQLQPQLQEQQHFLVQESLSTTILPLAPYHIQKQILGERMYPLIQHMCLELASKITGMLLEMDNTEIVHILDHEQALRAKVGEAVAVLQAHQAEQTANINMN